jgi:hypothetical protein
MEIQNLRGGVGREHRDLPADHVGDGLTDALIGPFACLRLCITVYYCLTNPLSMPVSRS